MVKTEIEEKFDYLVSKVIWPHFKPLGYKNGNAFEMSYVYEFTQCKLSEKYVLQQRAYPFHNKYRALFE